MTRPSKISPAVVRRLPKYRRILLDMRKNGINRTSSGVLAERLGCTASQIRQDLNNYGGFGQQGYGYNVPALENEISHILGTDLQYNIVLIGVGNLGQALAKYTRYYENAFDIKAIFDSDTENLDTEINGLPLRHIDELEEFIEQTPVDIGIITVPRSQAQSVADILVAGDVKGIWNFAPIDLEVPDTVVVKDVHLSDQLLELVYYINR